LPAPGAFFLLQQAAPPLRGQRASKAIPWRPPYDRVVSLDNSANRAPRERGHLVSLALSWALPRKRSSSTPRLSLLNTGVSGILDRPVKPATRRRECCLKINRNTSDHSSPRRPPGKASNAKGRDPDSITTRLFWFCCEGVVLPRRAYPIHSAVWSSRFAMTTERVRREKGFFLMTVHPVGHPSWTHLFFACDFPRSFSSS